MQQAPVAPISIEDYLKGELTGDIRHEGSMMDGFTPWRGLAALMCL
jgi:hypothetical protein